ncbi:MAG: tRNA lysidine(34) synthetase TilS [Verrucomicrobium sp.]|nr:tRNA lysidine(34) synthetase TilS [Verrucomicrobium sp.]
MTGPLDALPKKLLLGFSGGLDSCALLDALLESGRRPVLLHFDHGWRPESREDARWAAALAKRHKLTFHTARAAAGKKSEAEARRARWAFFLRAAKKTGLHDLALAHHADDQVETFLLQLLRGTGSSWSGMAPLSVRDGLTIHRPWLGVWRAEIASYAAEREIPHRNDSSNHDSKFLRNRIRLELLPLLEKQYAPGLRRLLHRTAEIQRAEQDWLEEQVAAQAASQRLPLSSLVGEPVAWQRRLLRRWLENRGVTGLSFEKIEEARSLLEKKGPAKLNLKGGRHLRRRAGLLFLE